MGKDNSKFTNEKKDILIKHMNNTETVNIILNQYLNDMYIDFYNVHEMLDVHRHDIHDFIKGMSGEQILICIYRYNNFTLCMNRILQPVYDRHIYRSKCKETLNNLYCDVKEAISEFEEINGKDIDDMFTECIIYGETIS